MREIYGIQCSVACGASCIQVLADSAAKYTCSKCKVEKEAVAFPAGANKGKQCKRCLSKTTTLSKMFKGWPIQAFTSLPEELQTSFWASNDVTKEAIFMRLEVNVTSAREEVHVSRQGGTYRPLSWYRSEGYDEEALAGIERNSSSRYDEELNCETYKLTLHSEEKEELRKEIREELMTLRDTTLRGRLSHYCSPLGKKSKKSKRRRPPSGSSGSSDSSTSSSSDSSAKPAETWKEQEKKKKDKEKEKAAAAKKAAKVKQQQEAAAKKAAAAEASRKAKSEAAQKKKEAVDARKAEKAAAKEDWRCQASMQ